MNDLIKLRRICEVQKQISIDVMLDKSSMLGIVQRAKGSISAYDLIIVEINKLINENVKKEVKEND